MSGSRVPGSLPGQADQPQGCGWIRPGVVVHDPFDSVDGLLASFAFELNTRGFRALGYVQVPRPDASGPPLYIDLATGAPLAQEPGAAEAFLRRAMAEAADLIVIGRFSACTEATDSVGAPIGAGLGRGLPLLTAIAGPAIHQWHSYVRHEGSMLAPDRRALWTWWGPDRLYRDLALGVAADEVRRITVGPRWIMVEGPEGAGLAALPRHPRELKPRLSELKRRSLRDLAALTSSWDPLETAVGVAALNAHYNRYDLEGQPGNGAHRFRHVEGQVVVIGAFPGVDGILPRCAVVEADPRPGAYPIAAMDALLPGCGGAIVNSSALINRSLPRILRLAGSRPIALVGPSTPMTARLYDYGVETLGGFLVRDPEGLAAAVEAGAMPRDFTRFGRYAHVNDGEGTLAGEAPEDSISM
ncbi:Rossmann-like domain-containing protein [Xanthobacter sediminis]